MELKLNFSASQLIQIPIQKNFIYPRRAVERARSGSVSMCVFIETYHAWSYLRL